MEICISILVGLVISLFAAGATITICEFVKSFLSGRLS
jgi:flagellar biosynthesis protein FliQ